MSLNIKEITETLEFNKDDLKGNRMLTNEIIVDDIMLGLGYNKRRDKSVQRLYEKLIDWIVSTSSGKKIAFKVLSYDETVDTASDMQDTLKYCADTRYSLLVVITGITITILRYNKSELVYNKVKDISLESDLSDIDSKLIESISKETFDIDFIDSCLKPSFTKDNVADLLSGNIDSLTDYLRTIDSNCTKEIVEQFIESLSHSTTESTDSSNDKLVSRLESELEAFKSEYDSMQKELNNAIEQLQSDLDLSKLELDNVKQESASQIETLKNELSVYEERHDKDKATIAQLKSEAEQLDNSSSNSEEVEQLEKAVEQLNSKLSQLEKELDTKDAEIEQLKNNQTTGDSDPDIQRKLDAYVEKIRELSVKVSEMEEERDTALQNVAKMQKEVEELSGSDLRFAEQLLASIEDDPEDDRAYVAVINKELLSYEDIHTFIGRCLQKLYDIKAFDASQFIFNGDIFKMDINSRFSDIVMNSKTYDVVLSTNNENEELNKLRVVFSHFDDVVFICKKIGTLRKSINSRYDIPEEVEEVQLESDEYLPDEYNQEEDITYNQENEEASSNGQEFIGDGYGLQEFVGQEFGSDEFNPDGQDTSNSGLEQFEQGQSFDDSDIMPVDDEEDIMPIDEDNTEESGMDIFQSPEEQSTEINNSVPYFDDDDLEDAQPIMEKHLLVGQLLNIDMMIWSEEPIKFNNIKYIGTNIITFGINTQDDSYDKLLCKCIDAILAIEAFNGSKDLVNRLKQKDFSQANNFLKVYTPEYAQYPRINGTKYVVAGIESVQQVAAALLDICNIMNIDTQEIFIYFEAETSSQFIIESYDFDENAIQLAETTSYMPEEGVEPHQAIAIIRGDMFNHIVITKNSLKAHKEVFNKALAVKTKYLALVVDDEEKAYEVMCDMLTQANNSGIHVDFRAIGNVIGESYMLVSNDESKVKDEHVVYNLMGNDIYISKLESWQVTHSLIKVHTALFNNTAIAVKTSVNGDAVNYYCNKFETSEPSLGLAVNSFADYVASCIKE